MNDWMLFDDLETFLFPDIHPRFPGVVRLEHTNEIYRTCIYIIVDPKYPYTEERVSMALKKRYDPATRGRIIIRMNDAIMTDPGLRWRMHSESHGDVCPYTYFYEMPPSPPPMDPVITPSPPSHDPQICQDMVTCLQTNLQEATHELSIVRNRCSILFRENEALQDALCDAEQRILYLQGLLKRTNWSVMDVD